MIKHLQIVFFLVSVLTSLSSFGQNDSLKTKQKLDGESGVVKSTNQLKAKSSNVDNNAKSNLNLHETKKLNVNAIYKNLTSNTPKQNENFLMETLPEDRDIIGRNYWKGKDVTNKKLESHLSLGTIYTKSKTVKIECRDHSFVDGDIIKIYINEKPITSKIVLKENYYVFYVNLNAGYNRIDFQAMNEGLSGPNTAELNVYDDNGNLISAKKWNLLTSNIATLGIINN